MRGGVAIRRSSSGADNGPAGAGTPQAGPSQAAQVDLSGFAELKAILRIRPFRRLWAVLGLSSLGDWLRPPGPPPVPPGPRGRFAPEGGPARHPDPGPP